MGYTNNYLDEEKSSYDRYRNTEEDLVQHQKPGSVGLRDSDSRLDKFSSEDTQQEHKSVEQMIKYLHDDQPSI